MMRRRRRRKSEWIWSDRLALQVHDTAGANSGAAFLLPPGRVKYLLDTAMKRSSLTTDVIHLWIDFHWSSATGATAVTLPDVYMYIVKTTEDENAAIAGLFDPFVEPQVPANITAWTVSPADGLDSFLWSHYIKGMTPPNARVFADSGLTVGNQMTGTGNAPAGASAIVCRTFSVRAEWQPDVIVKSKRRLSGGDGLIFGMFTGLNAAVSSNTQTFANVDLKLRILAH